jgi:hypothetical protein
MLVSISVNWLSAKFILPVPYEYYSVPPMEQAVHRCHIGWLAQFHGKENPYVAQQQFGTVSWSGVPDSLLKMSFRRSCVGLVLKGRRASRVRSNEIMLYGCLDLRSRTTSKEYSLRTEHWGKHLQYGVLRTLDGVVSSCITPSGRLREAYQHSKASPSRRSSLAFDLQRLPSLAA